MAKMTLDEFVAQLKSAFGASLRAVAVYGSAAAGEQHAGKSDINVLVVVDALGGDQLRAASATIASWTETNTAPLLLTTDEWKSSADIFAMEFADIRERNRVLHGAFPANLRLEDFPIVDAVLARLARVANHDAAFQLVQIDA